MSVEGLSRAADTLLDRTVAPGFSEIGYRVRRRLPTWPADPAPGAMTGRRALVTGATSGLGEATARRLLELGADVVLVARDEDKAARVRARLAGTGGSVEFVRCDLGDLDDVRRAGKELLSSYDAIDVVVHNAGALPAERTESVQGHELTMAVHVLGPVLLTELLRPALRGRDARVVLVTSGGAYGQRLRPHDPEYLDGEYSGTTAYARSKRAQIELLPVLAKRWAADRIRVWATHPGWADTPGVRDSLPGFYRVMRVFLRDADGGADTTVWLAAVEPAPTSGGLWHDRRERNPHLLPRTRTSRAQAEEMWAWATRQLDLS